MNEKHIARLLERQTTLDQTLQKQLVRSGVFSVRDAYAEIARVMEPVKQMRDAHAMVTDVNDTFAMLAHEMEYEQKQIRDAHAMVTDANDTLAMLAREAKSHQYWQKQTSLGFPNIIKGDLSIDYFHSLVPEQSYTPSPVSPASTITPEVYEEISPEIIPAPSPGLVPITNHKPVFIVHGHDHETRDEVSKFISNWGLTATILDKQPNKGRTIIEKFEDCADEAGFAIVLLTPDDVGASKKNKADLKYRARQNVIWEWGYFSGSIGRKKVCILYKGNLELPSDTQGIVYVRMDDNGEWKQAIVREMEDAALLIDANKI